MPRTLTVLALALLAACGSDSPTEPAAPPIAGSYVLAEGGKPGAYTAAPITAATLGTVLASTLSVRDDGTFTLSLKWEAQGYRRDDLWNGTYRMLTDSTFALRFENGNTRGGRVRGQRLLTDWESFHLLYARQ